MVQGLMTLLGTNLFDKVIMICAILGILYVLWLIMKMQYNNAMSIQNTKFYKSFHIYEHIHNNRHKGHMSDFPTYTFFLNSNKLFIKL